MTLMRKIYRSRERENGETEQILCHETLEIPVGATVMDVYLPSLFKWISGAISVTNYTYYDDDMNLAYVIDKFCRYAAVEYIGKIGANAPENPMVSTFAEMNGKIRYENLERMSAVQKLLEL